MKGQKALKICAIICFCLAAICVIAYVGIAISEWFALVPEHTDEYSKVFAVFVYIFFIGLGYFPMLAMAFIFVMIGTVLLIIRTVRNVKYKERLEKQQAQIQYIENNNNENLNH